VHVKAENIELWDAGEEYLLRRKRPVMRKGMEILRSRKPIGRG